MDGSSDDDNGCQIEETLSYGSSYADDQDLDKCFKDHFLAEDATCEDAESAENSDEDKQRPQLSCTVCEKPKWRNKFQPQNKHCRNYCMHGRVAKTIAD